MVKPNLKHAPIYRRIWLTIHAVLLTNVCWVNQFVELIPENFHVILFEEVRGIY